MRIEVVELSEGAESEKLEVEEIVAAWRQAIEAGELRVVVPSEPTVLKTEKLSDEELAGVAGGWCACEDVPTLVELQRPSAD